MFFAAPVTLTVALMLMPSTKQPTICVRFWVLSRFILAIMLERSSTVKRKRESPPPKRQRAQPFGLRSAPEAGSLLRPAAPRPYSSSVEYSKRDRLEEDTFSAGHLVVVGEGYGDVCPAPPAGLEPAATYLAGVGLFPLSYGGYPAEL